MGRPRAGRHQAHGHGQTGAAETKPDQAVGMSRTDGQVIAPEESHGATLVNGEVRQRPGATSQPARRREESEPQRARRPVSVGHWDRKGMPSPCNQCVICTNKYLYAVIPRRGRATRPLFSPLCFGSQSRRLRSPGLGGSSTLLEKGTVE